MRQSSLHLARCRFSFKAPTFFLRKQSPYSVDASGYKNVFSSSRETWTFQPRSLLTTRCQPLLSFLPSFTVQSPLSILVVSYLISCLPSKGQSEHVYGTQRLSRKVIPVGTDPIFLPTRNFSRYSLKFRCPNARLLAKSKAQKKV